MKEKDIDSLLNSVGLGFPETSNEIDLFKKVFVDYNFKSRIEAVDPIKILENARQKTVNISKVDYHKRTVLAAEIVFQLSNEWSLGHLKLQKLIYLCQHTTGMAIHTNFLKQAMGPYDPALMRSIDSQFKKQKWFHYHSDRKQKYLPQKNAEEHEK